MTGLNTTDFIAGRIELCIGVEWRAVCHGEWDVADAMVVCRQLGFPAEGEDICKCFHPIYPHAQRPDIVPGPRPVLVGTHKQRVSGT